MKCPRCGNEMTIDAHRRYPINMCYNCGYMEGQAVEMPVPHQTNFQHIPGLNFNELAAFLSTGLNIDNEAVKHWLEGTYQG